MSLDLSWITPDLLQHIALWFGTPAAAVALLSRGDA
jgi:hypothetical protein